MGIRQARAGGFKPYDLKRRKKGLVGFSGPNPEGVGRIFAPLAAFADGPFPEHYEPMESPIANPLHPERSTNPHRQGERRQVVEAWECEQEAREESQESQRPTLSEKNQT